MSCNTHSFHIYNDSISIDLSFAYYRDRNNKIQIKMYHQEAVEHDTNWIKDGNITPNELVYQMLQPEHLRYYAYIDKDKLNQFRDFDIINELESQGLAIYVKTDKLEDKEYYYVFLTEKFLNSAINLDNNVLKG